jgi:hypothetical protein
MKQAGYSASVWAGFALAIDYQFTSFVHVGEYASALLHGGVGRDVYCAVDMMMIVVCGTAGIHQYRWSSHSCGHIFFVILVNKGDKSSSLKIFDSLRRVQETCRGQGMETQGRDKGYCK